MESQRLTRNEKKGVWSGVLYGFAEYIEADPAIVRMIYCIFTLLTGVVSGLILYFIAAMCIPNKDNV